MEKVNGNPGNEAGGAGAAGYFGGYAGIAGNSAGNGGSGGGGGSSYVSGCEDCRTVYPDNTFHGPIHYSGLSFTSIEMYSGNDTTMPSYDYSSITYSPHIDDGLIRIKRLLPFQVIDRTCFVKAKYSAYILLYISIVCGKLES